MKSFAAILAAVALVPVAGALGYVAPHDDGAVDTKALVRFPALDSENDVGPFRIVCTAYSNDAGFDVQATPSKDMIGFRAVSDCRTLEPKAKH